jgi:hypothetical protein
LFDIPTPTSKNEIKLTNTNFETDNADDSIKNMPEIFCPKVKSRFKFCDKIVNNNSIQDVEVPQFVKTLIFKKVSRHNFTKYLRNIDDLLYSDKALKNEYEKKDPWAHFIIENKYSDQDMEFIEDFDYINKLVLNKCKAHKIIKQLNI